jgi:hypothetical protein
MQKYVIILIVLFCGVLKAYPIKPILVKYKCDLKTINTQEGDKRTRWTLNDPDGGWCYIYKTKHPKELVGHDGLLIYKKPFTYDYAVYDLRCPVCDKKKVSSTVYVNNTAVEAECDKCKTRYSLFTVGHSLNDPKAASEGLWLESYTFTIEDGTMYIDSSPGLGQRLRLWEAEQY